MNKKIIIKSALIICTVVLVWSVFLSLKQIVGFAADRLGNSKDYTSGDAAITETVQNLDIEWTSGARNIEYHPENTVLLHEESKKAISKDRQMRWKLDGDTLRVRYEKQGFRLFSLAEAEKTLTVTLPEGTVLEDVSIDATSAALNLPGIQADQLSLDVTSGEINAAPIARVVRADATSGLIRLQLTENAEQISITTTSGDILLEMADADQVHAGSTSGNIMITAKSIEDLSAGSTSGSVQVKTGSLETLKIDTTSGDVSAALPTQPGFTAYFDTTSGKVEYELPLAKQGDAYVCGDGSGTVKIDTTSGDISVTK